ncbi:MAG: hypothetical protein Q8O55_05025 [Dehalococcoidales bacterium]|nr:hypothetical protein [Dehalococcoidales bacterium]
MKLTRRLTLLTTILLGVSLLTQFLEFQEAQAAWNPAGETTVATYEVIPDEQRVLVTLSYNITNLDEETRSRRSYYYGWNASIPSEATNIRAYDSNRTLHFTENTEGSWTYLELQFNKELYYGQTYAFTIEYDLVITRNIAVFRAYGKGNGASTIKVILPRQYYDEVSFSSGDYFISETATRTTYIYAVEQEGWRFYTLVEAVRKSHAQPLTGTVKLQEREVEITVKFWDGEEDKAENILNLSIAALSVMEDVTGVAFPPAYQIVIEEVTREEIGGYAGANAGADGILISYTSTDSENVIVHELAHYWANQPPWKEPWMREGLAELYAYLTLVKLGKGSTAEKEIMEYRTSFYGENEDQFQLPLSLWRYTPVLTEENRPLTSFGYSKSFVFVFDLYSRYGAAVFQEANQVVYWANQLVDWFDYLHILETSTGQEMETTFAGWIVPETFGTAIDQWDTAGKAYWDTEETITARRGSLGITNVETELDKGRELIMNGNFTQALSQIQSTSRLFTEWQSAEKAFRETEETITARRGSLGITNVEVELDKGRELIMNGNFTQALSQIQSTSRLFTEWQSAEKAFSEAEDAIARAKSEGRTWRLGTTEPIMGESTTLLREGKLKESISQSRLARETADNTTTPLLGIITLLAPYLAGLAALLAVFFGGRLLLARIRES